MILTDREIQLALANAQIEITPSPGADAFSSTSVDFTLGAPGEVWKRLPGQPIRPGATGYSYANLDGRKDKLPSLDNYTLMPGAFVLGWTKTRPKRMAKATLAGAKILAGAASSGRLPATYR